jgi:hypothetical protein
VCGINNNLTTNMLFTSTRILTILKLDIYFFTKLFQNIKIAETRSIKGKPSKDFIHYFCKKKKKKITSLKNL